MLAITHLPSPNMQDCQRTHVAWCEINYQRALDQHRQYCRMLRHGGADVRTLEVHCELPDCVFIEDTAVVLDEVAILASMGTESRRREPAGIEPVLREYRPLERVSLPATFEGGDVLRVDRTLLVGLSARTNQAGITALETIAGRYGYRVLPVPIQGCLHLKSACTALPDGRLLVNPDCLDIDRLGDYPLVSVPPHEPSAANVALLGDQIWLSSAHPRTAEMLGNLGFTAQTVDISEFAKADGGVTCLRILIQNDASRDR